MRASFDEYITSSLNIVPIVEYSVERTFSPRTKGAPPMTANTTTKKEKLHQYIDEMDDYQTELVLSFLVTLFDLDLDFDG